MPAAKRHDIRENLLLALDTLRTHKFRAFLTILGVLIGTTTVIGVASIFKGLDQQLVDVAEGFGTRSLFIYKFDPGKVGPLTREERLRKPLTYEQAMAVKELCPSVQAVGVEIFNRGPAVTAKYQRAGDGRHKLRRGARRTISRTSTPTFRTAASTPTWTTFIGRMWPSLGPMWCKGYSWARIRSARKSRWTDIPLKSLGRSPSASLFWVTTATIVSCLSPTSPIKSLYPQAKENFVTALAFPGRLDQAKDEVTAVLRRVRNDKPLAPDSFGIATAQTFISNFRDIMGTVVLVTMVISSIGLMVGGIGVMNIMLVSVTERTREIGVRKAIGARRSDITWQFLLEAMTLTGAGGLLGILTGVTLSFLIRTLVPSLPSVVPLWAVVMGFVASVSIGLFFGMWPAMKASRLDPIVALRHE